MSLRTVLSGAVVALTFISSTRCMETDVTSTVTRVHVTCPCDESESTTLLSMGSTWNGWDPAFTNVDDADTAKSRTKSGGTHSIASSFTHGHDHPSDYNFAPTSQCYTEMNTKSKGFPKTSNEYHTTSCTVTSTTTITSVTTPAAPTSTVTASVTTITTAPTTTGTVTETSTVTATSVDTITETETDTATTTTTTVTTTTLAATVGFLGIDESIPGVSGSGGSTKHKRDVSVGDIELTDKIHTNNLFFSEKSVDDMFPGDVTCRHYTGQCSTVTTTTTTTSTASTPSTTTVTATTTISVVTTPGASTTTTITTTSTTVSTSTETTTTITTTTETSAGPEATYYAACDASTNQGYYYQGNGLTGAITDPLLGVAVNNGATTPYDCCVAGLLDPIGAVYGFLLSRNLCLVFEGQTCAAGQQSSVANQVLYTTGADPGFVFGNSNCGQFTSASI